MNIFNPINSEARWAFFPADELILIIIPESNGCRFIVGRNLVDFNSPAGIEFTGLLKNNRLGDLGIEIFPITVDPPANKV